MMIFTTTPEMDEVMTEAVKQLVRDGTAPQHAIMYALTWAMGFYFEVVPPEEAETYVFAALDSVKNTTTTVLH